MSQGWGAKALRTPWGRGYASVAPFVPPPSGSTAPAPARRRPRQRSHCHILAPLLPLCFSPPLPQGNSASRPARLRSILALAHVHLCPCPAPILQSPIRRSSHAATRPLSSDAAGRRSAGRFRQLRSEQAASEFRVILFLDIGKKKLCTICTQVRDPKRSIFFDTTKSNRFNNFEIKNHST